MSGTTHTESHANEKSASPEVQRFEEGTDNAHDLLDKTDSRTIANKLAAAAEAEKLEEEAEANKLRPTEIAKSHGNKPSRGAEIDEQLENEEREELERKGKA